jgi:hypothetical protein
MLHWASDLDGSFDTIYETEDGNEIWNMER